MYVRSLDIKWKSNFIIHRSENSVIWSKVEYIVKKESIRGKWREKTRSFSNKKKEDKQPFECQMLCFIGNRRMDTDTEKLYISPKPNVSENRTLLEWRECKWKLT